MVEFAKFCCPGCGRLLFKHCPDIELWLEIRCHSCKTIVRFAGDTVKIKQEGLTAHA